MEAVPLDAIVGQPTLRYVQHLVEYLVTFASHFATTKWGGNHGFLPLILSEAKVQPTARNSNIDCERLKKPDFLNPIIEDSTQGREILQFQADQEVEWQDYTFQEVVNVMATKAIVAAVDAQYVKEIKED